MDIKKRASGYPEALKQKLLTIEVYVWVYFSWRDLNPQISIDVYEERGIQLQTMLILKRLAQE